MAADPQISPDGSQIAYVRRTNDIMTDKAVSSIWLISVATGEETPLVTGAGTHVSPRWSPDGDRLAYISTESGGGPELHVRWMETGQSGFMTQDSTSASRAARAQRSAFSHGTGPKSASPFNRAGSR